MLLCKNHKTERTLVLDENSLQNFQFILLNTHFKIIYSGKTLTMIGLVHDIKVTILDYGLRSGLRRGQRSSVSFSNPGPVGGA